MTGIEIAIERMQELIAENAALKEQVAQLNLACDHYCETIAQQEEALRVKDEALKFLSQMAQTTGGVAGRDAGLVDGIAQAEKALAIHPNPDILRERDERLVERIAHGNIELDEVNLQWIADQIRKGEF